MKTRFLSLALAVVMLLSMIPGAVFAESSLPMFGGVSITLTNSFAINFKIPEANVTDFGKVVFTNGEEVLGTVTTLPAVENGVYTFSYKNIAPHKMDLEVTAMLYNSEETAVAQSKCSIETYCNTILANEGNKYSEELRMLAMEVLDYGAAAQKYVAAKAGSSVADADLVNNGISTSYTEIWTKSGSLVFDYNTDKVVGDALAEPAVKWTGVGLYLEDRISIRYKFTAESVEGLTMTAVCGDQTWDVEKFVKEEDYYLAYFSGLNPAQMREPVTVTMYKGDEAVSNSLTYSIESYVADAFTNADKTTKTLLQEMLYYGDAAAEYVPVAAKEALWKELVSMPVDETTVLGTNFASMKDNTSIATEKGHNDSYSVATDSTGRVQFKNTVSHTAGTWYRFSGYVCLGNVSASSLGFTVYQRKADNSGYNLPTFTTNSEVNVLHVEEADENGWSYFYFDIQHLYANTLLQINSAATGGTVYYDDIKYEKYLGEGQPPELETEEEEQTPEWKALLSDDFEAGQGNFSKKDGSGTVSVVEDTTRTGSAQVLKVDAKTRSQVSKSATLAKGYYKLSGYVKIGNNGVNASGIQIWAYQNSAGGNVSGDNLVNPVWSNCYVGKTDAEGWQFFEVIFDHYSNYTLIQFFLGSSSMTDVLFFDNVQYSKYVGTDTPSCTPG